MPELYGASEFRTLGRPVRHCHMALVMEPGGGSGSGHPLVSLPLSR